MPAGSENTRVVRAIELNICCVAQGKKSRRMSPKKGYSDCGLFAGIPAIACSGGLASPDSFSNACLVHECTKINNYVAISVYLSVYPALSFNLLIKQLRDKLSRRFLIPLLIKSPEIFPKFSSPNFSLNLQFLMSQNLKLS